MQSIMTPIALILAGLLIALGLLFGGRYEISPATSAGFSWRIDRLTRQLWICAGTNKGPGCRPVTAELGADGDG
jgi:hypothetical protein